MALAVLMKRKSLNEKNQQLTELRAKIPDFEKREAELEQSIDEAQTTEEVTAVEEEINAFEKERSDNESNITTLETEILDIEDEISKLEQRAVVVSTKAESTEQTQQREKRKDTNNMHINHRTKFFGLKIQERDSFIAREEVSEFLQRARDMGKEKRAINGSELGIPEVMLEILRDNMEQYSKLIAKVKLKPVKGKARQNITGAIPEGVWTEAVGALNELELTFTQIEVDGYKVGGFICIPNSTLEDSSNINLAFEIMDGIGQAIGYAIDKAIVYGDGNKKPVGILNRLALTAKPSWWGASEKDFTDLHTSNIKKLDINSKDSVAFFTDLLSALKIPKKSYSPGSKVWVMNEQTHIDLLIKALSFNNAGALVAGMQNTLPVIGGEIVELDFIPDNEIVGGYLDLYLLAEREGSVLAMSEHVKFLQDQTAYKGTARYDGRPVFGEAFVAVNFNNTAVTTSKTFAADTANDTVNP